MTSSPTQKLFVLKKCDSSYLQWEKKISGIIGYNIKRQATLCSSVVYKVNQGKKKEVSSRGAIIVSDTAV